MKYFYKASAIVLICVLFVYAGCKKSGLNKSSKTASEKVVAGIVVSNLTKSLAGTYGGVSIKDGINPPSQITASSSKLKLNSLSSLCGYTIDTTVTYTSNLGDSVKSKVTGKFSFTFTCSGSYPDGYKVKTKVVSKGKAPGYAFIYSIVQNYKVQALNAEYSLVSLDGILKSYGDFSDNPSAYVDTNYVSNNYQHQDYVLSNLKIDVAHGYDITSGTASFTSVGANAYGSWNYVGTIEYVGNHKAIITINGHVYNADLLTGVITPA
ncbi:MAG TPA: hypothetical protein VHA56_21535 [Mucilaginibacter sp.]|nr:hypothetical protein [Mucilaginibacter sp.]